MGLLSDLKDNVNEAEEVLLQGYPAESNQGGRGHGDSRSSHKSGLPSASSTVERLSSSRFLHYLDAVDSLQRVIDTCPPRVASTKQLISKAKSLLQQALAHLEEDFVLLLRSSAVPPSPEQVHAAARSLPITNSEVGFHNKLSSESNVAERQLKINDGLPDDAFLLFPKTVAACLQALAARLVASGREETCAVSFAQIRKAWLDSAVTRLCDKGQLRAEDVPLLEWEALEARVLTWQTFAKISVRVLLSQERKFCNFVFQGNSKLTSRCFGELASASGTMLTSFVEAFSMDKRLPERLFSMLDCCETLMRIEDDFFLAFHGDSRECVRLRGEYTAIQKRVGLAGLGIFAEFEAVVERDTSRVLAGGPGAGAVPRSTSYVMNYLSLLYEYRDTLISLLPEKPGASMADGPGLSNPQGSFRSMSGNAQGRIVQAPSWKAGMEAAKSDRSPMRPGLEMAVSDRGPALEGGRSLKLSSEVRDGQGSYGFLTRNHASFHGERRSSGLPAGAEKALASDLGRLNEAVPAETQEAEDESSTAGSDTEEWGENDSDDEEPGMEEGEGESSPVVDAFSREFWADGVPEYSRLAGAVLFKLEVLRLNYEAKAKQQIAHKDPALAALFLMNNLHYVARKVKETDLRRLLGDDWIRQQALEVRKHADTYISITWGKLAAALKAAVRPEGLLVPLKRTTIKQVFKQFNANIEEIHRIQSVWLVTPGPLRDELRVAVKQHSLPLYSDFYDLYAIQLLNGRHPTKYVKYDPLSARDLIMDLFSGSVSDPTRKQ